MSADENKGGLLFSIVGKNENSGGGEDYLVTFQAPICS